MPWVARGAEHNAETAASKLLLEGCWTVTEFQKRWLTVVTLPNYGIQLISRVHENEKYLGENGSVKVAATSSR